MVSNRSCFHGRGDLIYRLPTERGFLRILPCSRNWFQPTTGTTKGVMNLLRRTRESEPQGYHSARPKALRWLGRSKKHTSMVLGRFRPWDRSGDASGPARHLQ